MPNGGLSEYGSGLQLQPATPGVQQAGNANVAGVFIAGKFTTVQNDATGAPTHEQIFGNDITHDGTDNQERVFYGSHLAKTTPQMSGVIMGIQCSSGGPSSVAIGNQATVGASSINTNCVAIGNQVSASNGVPALNVVAMGYQVSVNGGNGSVGLGSNISMSGSNTNTGMNLCVGFNLQANNGNPTRIVLIGEAINIEAGRDNCLVVGWWGFARNFPGTPGNNSIIIGNIEQTNVQIGPYTIGPGAPGATQKIVDAAYTALPTDGTVIYTSITAARVVTLPAANAVPAGYRLLVLDSSGSASGVNTITLTRVGTDTINGGTTSAIVLAYGVREIVSDGVSKWTVVRSI